jgi:cysteine-rich repeat protein
MTHMPQTPSAHRRWFLALWLIAVHAGCLYEASQTCGDNSLCPPGKQCVDPGASAEGRICVAGNCGNGRPDLGEKCDDGNNRSGDGCPADCTASCGDGVLDPREVCDDRNTNDGDGCSADCRSLDGLSLVSPASVEFQANEGGPLPAQIIVTVRHPTRGDQVLIGRPPGVEEPPWLSVAERTSTPDSSAFGFRVTDTLLVSERATSVRLTIRHLEDIADDTFDLPISYRVAASDLAVNATPASLTFTTTEGDSDIASQPIDVMFNGDDVTLVSAPSWLIVTRPQAPTSPASFLISIDDPSPLVWTLLSGDAVFKTTRGSVQRRTSVHVEYQVFPPPDVAISATPDDLAFTAVTGAEAPPSQTVEVMFIGSNVEVVSAPSWLTVTAPALPTSPASFTVAVNTTAFAGGTVQKGDIRFGTTRDGTLRTAIVRVEYALRYVPELLFVAPYLGRPDRGGTLFVRGRGLQTGNPLTIRIGELTLGPVTPDSDTLITLSYPGLPAGRYPVTLIDPPAVSPRAPELVIVAPPAFPYAAIDAPGDPNRIVYDAERQMLYSASRSEQQIKRFVYANGTWTQAPAIAVPQLADIAMAPDGRSLIVVDRFRINEMSLTDGLYLPVERARPPETSFCTAFSRAAAANNGKVLVLSIIPVGSGLCPAYFYDMIDHGLVSTGDQFYFGNTAASGDGSRIYATHGDAPLRVYDMLAGTSSSINVDGLGMYAISASRDASRVIIDDSLVYSRSLRLTGNVPRSGSFSTLISHDGGRAFVFPNEWIHPRLDVYDLNGPLQSGAMYPLLRTIALPDIVNDYNDYAMAMTSTPDDAIVFVAGAYKLAVIPVN